MIKFLVKGQNIETLEHEIIADNQVSFVNVHFVFDNNWKPLHKVVQFAQDEFVYNMVLGYDATVCKLPSELHAGAVKMSLFGYDTSAEDTVRATTVIHTLHIRPSGFDGESTPIPPTPDLYQQLLEKIREGANGKSAYEIAVEHGFIGTEEEWLNSLHGKDGTASDMDFYPKKDEIIPIIEELLQMDLQQFIDATKEDIHTLYEYVNNYNGVIHSHDNKEILDKINALPDETKYATNTALIYLQETVKNWLEEKETEIQSVKDSMHSHRNLSVLESITSTKIINWTKAYSQMGELESRIKTMEDELTGIETILAKVVDI